MKEEKEENEYSDSKSS